MHNNQEVIRNYTQDILKSDSLVKTFANSQMWSTTDAHRLQVEECMKPQMKPTKNPRQGLKKHWWAELLSNHITSVVVKSFFNELKFTQGN